MRTAFLVFVLTLTFTALSQKPMSSSYFGVTSGLDNQRIGEKYFKNYMKSTKVGFSYSQNWKWINLKYTLSTILKENQVLRNNEFGLEFQFSWPAEDFKIRPFIALTLDYGLQYYRWKTHTFTLEENQIQQVETQNIHRISSFYGGLSLGFQVNFFGGKIQLIPSAGAQKGNSTWAHKRVNLNNNGTSFEREGYKNPRLFFNCALVYRLTKKVE